MELNLIVEAEAGHPGPTEVLAERKWCIMQYSHLDGLSTPYKCISYTWGPGKAPNLFAIPGEVSDRTRPVLEASMLSCFRGPQKQAFWIDAVCVPSEGIARRATLESMGNIYSRAESVIVPLKFASWKIVSRDATSSEPYTEAQMDVLNQDQWVKSVWTYQEIVNAAELVFTAERLPPETGLSGDDFLNSIGISLRRYKQRYSLSALDIRRRFPSLDVLEDTVLDWRLAGYLERSMLTCLVGVSGRYCDPTRPANRMYAVLGALTQEPSWGTDDESVTALVDKSIELCNAKGDFSYIFTSEARQVSGQRWRPQSRTALTPVLSWHCSGERQYGSLREDALQLQDMVRLKLQSTPSPDALGHLKYWLHEFTGFPKDDSTAKINIVNCLLLCLRSIGFTGCDRCYWSESGLIILQDEVKPGETLEAYASGSISWVFGAPGIARVLCDNGQVDRYTVVVYLGDARSRETRETLLLEH